MARHLLRLFAALALFVAPGCVRIPFDLCDEADAHPDCMSLDGSANVTDASRSDAGVDGGDAG